MTYELFSVVDKYIQDLIEALFFLLLTGHKPHNHRHNLKKKNLLCSRTSSFIYFPSFLFIFFCLLLLCGCNSRRFCFRTVMNDLSFFLFLWQAFVRLHLLSSCSCCYSLTFSSSFSKVLPFLPRPSCVSPPSCRLHNKIVTRAEKSLMHHLKGVLFGPVRSRSIHTEKRGKKRRIEWFPGKQRKFLASITFSGRIVQDDRLYFVCMFAQTRAAIAKTWGFTLSNSRPKKKKESW